MFRFISWLTIFLLLAVPVVAMAQEDLTETYSSYDGALTFNYPAGWIVWGYDNTWGYVANSQAARETSDKNGQFASGQVVVSMHVIPFATPEEVVTIEDILEGMQAAYGSDSSIGAQYNIDVEPVSEPAVVNGMDNAVETTYRRTGADFAEEVLNIVIVNGETGIVEISATTPEGETAQYHDLVLTIVMSLRYNPPAAGGLIIPGAGPAPVAGTGNILWVQERLWGTSPENFNGVRSLAVSADDLIYVADGGVGVRVLDADGNLLHTVANTEITNLDDVAVAEDGTLWIVNTYNSNVYHVDAQGNMLGSFGEIGTEPGQFDELSPMQVEIGTDGNLYFFNHHLEGDTPSGEIVVYTQDWTFVREFLTDTDPTDIAILFGNVQLAAAPDGTLYTCDLYTTEVRSFAPDGTVVKSGIGAQFLMGAQQVAVGSDGSIYAVGSFMDSVVYKFDPDGNLLGQYPISSVIAYVSGMGVLSDGSVIVAGVSSTQDASVVLRLVAG